MASRSLVRPLVRRLRPYVPGEQPRIPGLIKLNTNENPYPPPPGVLAAIKAATDGRLRLYPNPTADRLRGKLARWHRCAVENLIVGNGSDELLALATRAFVEPVPAGGAGQNREPESNPRPGTACGSGDWRSIVQYFVPSYSLYPVLADIHGASRNAVPLRPDFALPSIAGLRRSGAWNFRAALTFITTPNAPSGRGYSTKELEALCDGMKGVVVLDEAYVDFGREHAMRLALDRPHVLVARTFSKAYSLCFQRVGYMVGHPALIGAVQKIRDSYNVNGLGQIAAEATFEERAAYRRNFRRVIATRERLSKALRTLGFEVFPSQANFILVQPPGPEAREWFERLRERKILVRWFDDPAVAPFLRVSIGTDADADALVKAAASILESRRAMEGRGS